MSTVGMTISLAGIATTYARRITPFIPSRMPTGSSPSMKCAAMLSPPQPTFAISQITAPAGAAKTIARQSTISVRSMMLV